MNQTTNYNLNLPEYKEANWHIPLKANFEIIDENMKQIDNKTNNMFVIKTGKYTANTTTNTFLITEDTFSPTKDTLILSYKGIKLEKDENYSLVGNEVTLGFDLQIGEVIDYQINKTTTIQPENLYDGGLLENDTVNQYKLTQDVRDTINKVPVLETQLADLKKYKTGGKNALLYFEARKANNGTAGINSPFTSTITDLSENKNDITLNNFSGTATDGYCELPIISSTGTDRTFNNLLGANGNFATDSNSDGLADNCISSNVASLYNFGNVQMFTATAANGEVGFNNIVVTSNDSIYVCAEVLAFTSNVSLVINDGAEVSVANNDWDSYNYNFLSVMKTVSSNSLKVTVRDTATSAWIQTKIKNIHVFDLNNIFSGVTIPTKAQMDTIIREALRKYGYINSKVLKIAYMTFLSTDGIDSYGTVKDNLSFDFRGGDFAIAGVFVTPSNLKSGFIISRSLDYCYENVQFGLYLNKNTTKGFLSFRIGNDSINLTSVTDTITPSTLYTYKVKRVNGILKCEINGTEVYSGFNNSIPPSFPNTFIFGRSLNSIGNASMDNFSGYTALLAVYGGDFIESDFDNWCNTVFADYIAPITYVNASKTVCDMLGVGINIGNTMDSKATEQNAYELLTSPTVSKEEYFETLAGNILISQEYINMLKDKGFKTIRVPITWWNHMDTSYNIDIAWLARVKQVIDYIIDSNTYCIINTHHDTWLKADSTTMVATGVNFTKVWTQIATYFKDYNDHLIFEGYNEILNSTSQWEAAAYDDYSASNYFNQLFVNAVRATGSNNANRYLCANIYAASPKLEVISKYVIPTDTVKDRIMVQIHCYETSLNTLHWFLDTWKSFFTQKGIPCILGEFAMAFQTALSTRINYTKFVVGLARQYNIPCIWWDDGSYNHQVGGLCNFAIMDRVALTWKYPEIADVMVATALGTFTQADILALEPPAKKTLTFYREMGMANQTFSNPGCYLNKIADNNYYMWKKINVSKLKSRTISFSGSYASLVLLAEFNIYGDSVYTAFNYCNLNENITLNQSTVYIQFCNTWFPYDYSSLTLNYCADETLRVTI
jgi:aryl-phospho-beta-D-glucosidase BglC (GH1 family)